MGFSIGGFYKTFNGSKVEYLGIRRIWGVPEFRIIEGGSGNEKCPAGDPDGVYTTHGDGRFVCFCGCKEKEGRWMSIASPWDDDLAEEKFEFEVGGLYRARSGERVKMARRFGLDHKRPFEFYPADVESPRICCDEQGRYDAENGPHENDIVAPWKWSDPEVESPRRRREREFEMEQRRQENAVYEERADRDRRFREHWYCSTNRERRSRFGDIVG